MRKTILSVITLILIGTVGQALAQVAPVTFPLRDYRDDSWMVPQSPSVSAGPVGGLFNPAGFAFTDAPGLDLWCNDRDLSSGLDNFGLAGGRTLNFSVFSGIYGAPDDNRRLTDYQIGFARGSRSHAWGLGYRWSGGDAPGFPRQKALTTGMMIRPTSWLTFGTSSAFSLESSAAQYVFDLGLRPLGTPMLTLFADMALNNDRVFFQDGSMGYGLEVRPLPGLHLGFRARERVVVDEYSYTFSLGLSLNDWNLTGANTLNEDMDRIFTSALVRTATPYAGRPVSSRIILPNPARYYALNLENKILTYQKHRWFDDQRVAWLDLLELLEALRQDDEITAVAINLAGFRARPSLVWEFRQQLERIRAAGKGVYIHTDGLNAAGLQLASVADRLSLDPWGFVELPGTALTRSYLKGTMEKLGLGFQEHRYFKYKSAAETASRTDMSEADREQRQRIVDVIYETRRDQSAEGRDLNPARIDQVIDEMVVLTAERALAAGLVDTLGRWDGLTRWVTRERQAHPAGGPPSGLKRQYWDEPWGRLPRIPVVYAVGACAMDSGIKGRATSAYLRSLVKDSSVVAVVLRADSPGGDPLPSDLVGEAVRQLRAAGKPVIISQGDVAASGGYWISMDGTEILTTPVTITGSVGVISGWVWDDGIAEKMGVTADSVQRGAHADLFSQINLPFLGGLPRRAMTDEELEMTKSLILEMYDAFVEAVAGGRGLSVEAVEAIAQGRVWMGPDAVANGLCDRIGSLDDAIQAARRLAGVPADRKVQVTEYPPRPLIKWPSLGPTLPSIFGLGDRINGWLAGLAAASASGPETTEPSLPAGIDLLAAEYLKTFTGAAGKPVLMVDPDLLPQEWRTEY